MPSKIKKNKKDSWMSLFKRYTWLGFKRYGTNKLEDLHKGLEKNHPLKMKPYE